MPENFILPGFECLEGKDSEKRADLGAFGWAVCFSADRDSKLALPRWPTQAQTAKLSSRAAYCFSLRDFSKGQGKRRHNHDWI
jgi:hypothetical protein